MAPVNLDSGGGLVNLVSVIVVVVCISLFLMLDLIPWDVVVVVDATTVVVVEVGPIICCTVTKASSLLSSQVIATVLVAVVGIGLTILLRVDNLPWDVVLVVPLILLVVLRGNLRDGVGGVIVRAVLFITVVGGILVCLGVGGCFSSVCPCLGHVSSVIVSLIS